MATSLRTTQAMQVQSFWNLIQTSDEGVQRELYFLMKQKYAKSDPLVATPPAFLKLKGILRGVGSEAMDKAMIDEYLQEKYGRL